MTKLSELEMMDDCTQSQYARYRAAVRDLLLLWSTSDLALHTENDRNKIYEVSVSSVLFEAWRLTTLNWITNRMDTDFRFNPIDVVQYNIYGLRYFVILDGNHLAAAHCIFHKPLIRAHIHSIIDLSFAPIYVDENHFLFLKQSPGVYTVTGKMLGKRERYAASRLIEIQEAGQAVVEKQLAIMRESTEIKHGAKLQRKKEGDETRQGKGKMAERTA